MQAEIYKEMAGVQRHHQYKSEAYEGESQGAGG